MENKNIYIAGIYFNRVHPNTPDSVKAWKKGSIAIDVDKAIAHLTEMKSKVDDKGYIRYDLVENEKNGEKFLSFRFNDYKPEKKEEGLDSSSIPF